MDKERKETLLHVMAEKDIVNEACGIAHSVCATLRKWYIQPNQIRKWRAHDAAEGVLLLEYPVKCTAEGCALIKS